MIGGFGRLSVNQLVEIIDQFVSLGKSVLILARFHCSIVNNDRGATGVLSIFLLFSWKCLNHQAAGSQHHGCMLHVY